MIAGWAVARLRVLHISSLVWWLDSTVCLHQHLIRISLCEKWCEVFHSIQLLALADAKSKSNSIGKWIRWRSSTEHEMIICVWNTAEFHRLSQPIVRTLNLFIRIGSINCSNSNPGSGAERMISRYSEVLCEFHLPFYFLLIKLYYTYFINKLIIF